MGLGNGSTLWSLSQVIRHSPCESVRSGIADLDALLILMIDLANRQHVDRWFCMLHQATDDCVRLGAEIVLARSRVPARSGFVGQFLENAVACKATRTMPTCWRPCVGPERASAGAVATVSVTFSERSSLTTRRCPAVSGCDPEHAAKRVRITLALTGIQQQLRLS